VIWSIIAIGGLLTVAFTDLFGSENFRLHLAMTGAVAAALALVVVLIAALDWPFRGEVSVTPEAYENVVHGWLRPRPSRAIDPLRCCQRQQGHKSNKI
jgi:hypothetical protein